MLPFARILEITHEGETFQVLVNIDVETQEHPFLQAMTEIDGAILKCVFFKDHGNPAAVRAALMQFDEAAALDFLKEALAAARSETCLGG